MCKFCYGKTLCSSTTVNHYGVFSTENTVNDPFNRFRDCSWDQVCLGEAFEVRAHVLVGYGIAELVAFPSVPFGPVGSCVCWLYMECLVGINAQV